MIAVSLQTLTKSFGDVCAVDSLTFDVSRGELFGLVGPDGAGKTTTLRMLAGVARPTAGDALVDGISVSQDPETVKHRIAYMSQRFGLYTDLTVRENIEFYADLYAVPQSDRPPRIERLYEFSHLGPFEHRLAGNLSGGMKQKLSLCCALIHRPKIMLLDEPTFGVDPISRRDLWLIVHQMVSDGVTVIVSTAYLDEAERCDKVVLLDRGRILALDSPRSIQQSIGDLLVLVTSAPRTARDIAGSVPGVTSSHLFGQTLHLTSPDPTSLPSTLAGPLREAGVEILSATVEPPSLEDAFIDLVGKHAGG
ncbi:MAG: ATP-binding cassette domain-containing protein [Gemmatimonadales bacterium]